MNDSIEISDKDRDLIVAMHEAGHAVACVRLSVPFREVSIGRDGAAVDTVVARQPECALELAQYIERCRAQIMVAFAGPIAEVRAAQGGLTQAVGIGSSRQDDRDSQYFARQMIHAQREIASLRGESPIAMEDVPQTLVAELGALRCEAETLVEAEFAAIEVVARRLVEAGRMTAEEVAGVCG